jgi:hypothetical protein
VVGSRPHGKLRLRLRAAPADGAGGREAQPARGGRGAPSRLWAGLAAPSPILEGRTERRRRGVNNLVSGHIAPSVSTQLAAPCLLSGVRGQAGPASKLV